MPTHACCRRWGHLLVALPLLGAAACRSAPKRIVALGDVHGDLSATRRALRLAGAIDDQDRWIGGRLVVVQTGDQLGRAPLPSTPRTPFSRGSAPRHAPGWRPSCLEGPMRSSCRVGR
jgi:hypothetical protein